MNEESIKIEISKPFGNLYRDRCVLVAAFDDKHNLLLGAKPDFYPPGIVRLLGGGVDEGENIKDAACRELLEETGVAVHKDKIHIKTKFSIRAIDCDGNAYNNDTYLVCANIESTPVNPGDDVKQIIKYKSQDLERLIDNYRRLSPSLWYKGAEGEFSWYDYAQVYAVIHNKVLEMF